MGGPQQQPKHAVALRYDEDHDDAPMVVASGVGAIADKIVEAAKQAGVPVRADALLLTALAKLDLGEAIPPELYPAVAEVLAFIGRMNREAGNRPARSAPRAAAPTRLEAPSDLGREVAS